ncbi:DUF2304 domain-containing protein [Streptomyces sp. So13.3]|uniref:DUF2304 domain-containing protein n=1 Tax=Streptomyces sp. So13.3 TaxID=2136173 RepID=UPI0011057E41|nr:DUF2304 domain-containing protein [Streptomyces sp. So13.3]QNA72049.1 DUF2304 domain-containing protein [Streptomyces sp. So13.3]
MALSVSLVILLLIVVVLLIRQKAVKPVPALVCALLGFELASSRAAPAITKGVANLASVIAGLHF